MTKKVVLTFDDAVKNHLTFVAPLLKSYGFNASFFVGSFPCRPEEKSEFLSWSECAKLAKMGFDVGNHTLTHADLPSLGREEQLREIVAVEDALTAAGAPRPESFAYPCCKYNDDTLSILRERRYRYARIGGEEVYRAGCGNLLVPSFPVHGESEIPFFRALEKAEQENGIAVMMFHGVSDRVHPWVNTPQVLFQHYCRSLRERGYTVLSLCEL